MGTHLSWLHRSCYSPLTCLFSLGGHSWIWLVWCWHSGRRGWSLSSRCRRWAPAELLWIDPLFQSQALTIIQWRPLHIHIPMHTHYYCYTYTCGDLQHAVKGIYYYLYFTKWIERYMVPLTSTITIRLTLIIRYNIYEKVNVFSENLHGNNKISPLSNLYWHDWHNWWVRHSLS